MINKNYKQILKLKFEHHFQSLMSALMYFSI